MNTFVTIFFSFSDDPHLTTEWVLKISKIIHEFSLEAYVFFTQ